MTAPRSIVIDSSAVVALATDEPAADAIQRQLERATACSIAAPTVVELSMVLIGRLGDEGERRVQRFLDDAEVDVVTFDEQMATLAVEAFRRFGKGRHPAGLNLGDCFSYALSAATGDPLLCTGDDFRRTDRPVVDLDGEPST